jgi:hypothetical protein
MSVGAGRPAAAAGQKAERKEKDHDKLEINGKHLEKHWV